MDTPIVNRQGSLLSTEGEVLNRPPLTVEEEEQEPDTELDVSTTSPEKEEIMAAIRSLNNGKAPGQESLDAELTKADPEFAAQVLQPLFAVIWEQKQLPDDGEGLFWVLKSP